MYGAREADGGCLISAGSLFCFVCALQMALWRSTAVPCSARKYVEYLGDPTCPFGHVIFVQACSGAVDLWGKLIKGKRIKAGQSHAQNKWIPTAHHRPRTCTPCWAELRGTGRVPCKQRKAAPCGRAPAECGGQCWFALV